MSEWYETFKDLSAGTIGGCAGIVVGQPLDTIKVRLQSQGTSASGTSTMYKGPVDALVKMVKYEGPRSLFKGLLPPLLGNAPMNAIAFGAYGNANRTLTPYFPNKPRLYGTLSSSDELREAVPMKEQEELLNHLKNDKNHQHSSSLSTLTMDQLQRNSTFNSNVETPNFQRLFLAGCWSGLLQTLATTPAELIKCKLQAQEEGKKVYKGVWDCGVQMCKAKGWRRGLYTGFWTTVWRDGPGMGAYFVAYEYAKWMFRTEKYEAKVISKTPSSSNIYDLPIGIEWKHSISYSTLGLMGAGGVAGIATWIVTYPFDCIKSVVQTLPDNAKPYEYKMKYIAINNYNKYGLSFFFRGLGTTIVRAVPVNAATFLIYEESLKLFKRLEKSN